MFKVWMIIEEEEYCYGIYTDRDRANKIARIVRKERGCDTWVQEVVD